jgi:hypothetical protein
MTAKFNGQWNGRRTSRKRLKLIPPHPYPITPAPKGNPMTKTYAPHEQRVIDESDALDGNLTKLRSFLGSPIYEGLPALDQHLMREQALHMGRYLEVLSMRIARF